MDPIGREIALQNHRWRVGEPLDAGGFASVHLASSEWCQDAVVKLIPKSPGANRELLFEDLGGVPNVVPVLDRGEWEDFWVLAMPRAAMSLRQHLQEGPRVNPVEAVQILKDIAEALVALENRVVHRDIKPENILLLADRWCLADFGISRYVDATTATNTWKNAKTRPYAAPEQWREEAATSATDIYATGVIAYELLAGQRPFAGPSPSDFRDQHLHGKADPIADIPAALDTLVLACLGKSPGGRPRAEDLVRRLKASMTAPSAAGSRLRQADATVTRRRAEEERLHSVAVSAEERRRGLLDSARESFRVIVEDMRETFLEHTSEAEVGQDTLSFACSLGDGLLTLGTEQMKGMPDRRLGFEVIDYTNVSVTFPGGRDGYEGRSHSLWYCDAQEKGAFRWYETAFMLVPTSRRRPGSQNPIALSPHETAYLALRPGTEMFRVAWPFTPIDHGEDGEFIERWMEWFAEATERALKEPTRMPERETGSWRWEG